MRVEFYMKFQLDLLYYIIFLQTLNGLWIHTRIEYAQPFNQLIK